MELIKNHKNTELTYKQNKREAKLINTLCELIAEKTAEKILKDLPEQDVTKKVATYSKKLENTYQSIRFEPKKSKKTISHSREGLSSYIHNFFVQKVLHFSIQQTNDLLLENACKFLPAISIVLNEAILQNAYNFTLPTTPSEVVIQYEKNTQLQNIHYEKILWQNSSVINRQTEKVLNTFYTEKGYTPKTLYRIIQGCFPTDEGQERHKSCILL